MLSREEDSLQEERITEYQNVRGGLRDHGTDDVRAEEAEQTPDDGRRFEDSGGLTWDRAIVVLNGALNR